MVWSNPDIDVSQALPASLYYFGLTGNVSIPIGGAGTGLLDTSQFSSLVVTWQASPNIVTLLQTIGDQTLIGSCPVIGTTVNCSVILPNYYGTARIVNISQSGLPVLMSVSGTNIPTQVSKLLSTNVGGKNFRRDNTYPSISQYRLLSTNGLVSADSDLSMVNGQSEITFYTSKPGNFCYNTIVADGSLYTYTVLRVTTNINAFVNAGRFSHPPLICGYWSFLPLQTSASVETALIYETPANPT